VVADTRICGAETGARGDMRACGRGAVRDKSFFFVQVECWPNACESDMSKKEGFTFLFCKFFQGFRWF